MCCALSTAGPPPQRIAAGAQGVRTTGQKGLRTYRKNQHGKDVCNDDGDDINDGGEGNGGCEGKGIGVSTMGGPPTNLGVAILV